MNKSLRSLLCLLIMLLFVGGTIGTSIAQDEEFETQEQEQTTSNKGGEQKPPPKFIQDIIKAFKGKSKKNGKKPEARVPKKEPQKTAKKKPKPKVSYEGYSKRFAPIKKMLVKGDVSKIMATYNDKDRSIKKECSNSKVCYMKKVGLLGCLERGTLFLDMGRFKDSVDFFSGAEFIIKSHENWSKAHSSLVRAGSSIAGFVSGYEEIKPYYGTGFERVLMLNYKTISFMLKGDRRAYNVTRRAIDLQNMERRIFEEKHKEIAQKLREKKKEVKKNKIKDDVAKQVANAYKKTDARASTVASAYVNPFGYYMAGVIHELGSLEDHNLIDNARISYKKALKLNPKSRVIRSAVRDLRRRKQLPRNRKLVHVIINEGFAPEKKVLTYYFAFGGAIVPVKLPIYEPDKSKVYRVEVKTLRGKRIALLSPIADVEAIVLRHQKDMKSLITLRVMTSLLRCYLEKKLLGNTLTEVKELLATPDTRSWMMLPKTILGARFYVPRRVRKVMIVAYDKRWRRIAKRIVTLDRKGPTFIYGRSMNRFLEVYNHKGLWTKKL